MRNDKSSTEEPAARRPSTGRAYQDLVESLYMGEQEDEDEDKGTDEKTE